MFAKRLVTWRHTFLHAVQDTSGKCAATLWAQLFVHAAYQPVTVLLQWLIWWMVNSYGHSMLNIVSTMAHSHHYISVLNMTVSSDDNGPLAAMTIDNQPSVTYCQPVLLVAQSIDHVANYYSTSQVLLSTQDAHSGIMRASRERCCGS